MAVCAAAIAVEVRSRRILSLADFGSNARGSLQYERVSNCTIAAQIVCVILLILLIYFFCIIFLSFFTLSIFFFSFAVTRSRFLSEAI